MKKYLCPITAVSLFLLAACSNKHTEQQPQLKDIADRQVLALCDSIDNSRPAIRRKPPQALLNRLQGLLLKFPYDKDSATRALLEAELGNLYLASVKIDSAFRYAESALPYFEAHPGFIKPLFQCYKVLGITMSEMRGNNFKSNYYATKAASLSALPGADTILTVPERIEAAYAAANTNLFCQYPEQAIHFGQSAIKLAEAHMQELPSHYGRASQAYVSALLTKGKLDSAKYYIDKEQEWVERTHYDKQLNELYNSKINYFYCAKQYDSLLHYLVKTDWTSDPFQGAYTYLELYTLLKKPDSAKKHLLIAEEIMSHNDSLPTDMLRDFYHHKTRYEIWYGNPKETEAAFAAFDSLSLDLGNKERMEMAASIESEYNLADKQKRLDKLNEAGREARLEIRQKNSMLIITILGILLCIVIIIALLLLSRQRKLRTSRQMAEAQRNRIALEQRLLRTQMEPHFIFNTLSVMQALIHNKENEKAATYLHQFAQLLRTSLEHSRENYVLVSEEVGALVNYISLQAMRFGNTFDYSLQLYEGYEEDRIKIPAMLLQPFVENAIQHGVMHMPYKGHIDISIEKRERVLYCRIKDNGKGLSPSSADQPGSLAIRIARERLQALSSETNQPATIEVANKPAAEGSGTAVDLVIPFV